MIKHKIILLSIKYYELSKKALKNNSYSDNNKLQAVNNNLALAYAGQQNHKKAIELYKEIRQTLEKNPLSNLFNLA